MNFNIDPTKPVYLITVPHSGTHSVRRTLDDMGVKYRFTHYEKVYEITIDNVIENNQVITTYRDPFLVAASWANRMVFGPKRTRRFMANWTRWGLMVDRSAKVVTTDQMIYHENSLNRGDPSGAVAAYEAGDWDRYYSIVPKIAIHHAEDIAREAGYLK